MDFAFTAEAGLAGLYLASFLSATLLPGGSEVVLVAVVHQHPGQALPGSWPAKSLQGKPRTCKPRSR